MVLAQIEEEEYNEQEMDVESDLTLPVNPKILSPNEESDSES